MLNKGVRHALASASLALAFSATAQQQMSTHIVNQGEVIKVATTLNHVSVIQLPEPVLSAVIGSEAVQMEYRGDTVLVKPLLDNIKTDLFVWTASTRTTYELTPAADGAGSYVINEKFPAPPPPPPTPSTLELEVAHDQLYDPLLLSTRTIKPLKVKASFSLAPQLLVTEVASDYNSYFVKLKVFNGTAHAYRVSPVTVNHIEPLFGARMALLSMNQQLSEKKFASVLRYDSARLSTHGSTLVTHDMRPGETYEWVVGVHKPEHSPAMYEFALPVDGDTAVRAVAVF